MFCSLLNLLNIAKFSLIFKYLDGTIINVYVISKSWRDANSLLFEKMAKVNDLIASWMSEMEGYELSRSEFVKEANTWYLRVYVDKLENGEYLSMSTDDCEKVSRFLSEKLDKNDPIEQNYYLEVSSPGLDRLLVSEKDFKRFAGEVVDVKLYKALDGKKELSGVLLGVDNEILKLKIDNDELQLAMSSIAKINLAVIF